MAVKPKMINFTQVKANTMASKHIGSSSFITDRTGIASQHLQYLPFGELFVEQQTLTNYSTPYKFSGKEKDEETSYSYFGARYYLSDISIWASVDPMRDKRSWLSPYNYCQWNPIMLTDPTGMLDDGYTIDENGFLQRVDNTGGNQFDVIYNKNDYDSGKRDYDESGTKSGLKLNNTNILPALAKSTNVDVQTGWDAETGTIIETFKLSQYSTGNNSTKNTKNEILKLFYFASDNSKNAEWRLHKTKQGSFNISTFHQSSDAPSDYDLGVKTSNVDWMIHSHPDTKNNITAEKKGQLNFLGD